MLNFFNKEKLVEKDNILLFSKNKIRADLISKQLAIKGYEVIFKQNEISQISQKDLNVEIKALIIELGLIDDHLHLISDICKILVPNIPCICLGDNDSIKIHQDFSKAGICYLHYESQIDYLHSYLNDYKASKINPLKISILGCKGGCGASMISYFCAKMIFEKFQSKVLLVQGESSSFNIDFLADKKFENDFYESDEVSFYKESKENLFSPDAQNLNYNFCVYDANIHAANKEKIESILAFSDTAILVINANLAAIRCAKEAIEINEFLKSANRGCKKLILLFNENSSNSFLTFEQISSLLEKKIDIAVPFFKTSELGAKMNSKCSKKLSNLLDQIFKRA